MTDPTAATASLLRRFALFLERHSWLLIFMFAAFAVRLHWNLEVHAPGDYIYSDMRGYIRRADLLLATGFKAREYDAFYPYGTHVLLYLLKLVFGKEGYVAIGVLFAGMGALTVGYGYALARRVSSFRAVPIIVGAVLVCYYPLISLGGYFLSEVPFSLCLTAATFYLVRMIDEGKLSNALGMGIFVALGMTVRPQILLSVALIGLLWLIRRKAMPKAKVSLWVAALVPILLLLAFSAWRVHFHTGRYGLISENGTFNQVFGRCHNKKITALPDTPQRRRTSFGPPPLIQLAKRADRTPGQWPQLDAARELDFEYRGYIGDSKILGEYIDDCVKRTGWWGQLNYSATNIVLQWRYNVMWPDSGKGAWQPYSRKWGLFVANVLAVPALLGLFAVFFPRRFPKLAVVSLHLWALTGVGIFYLGGQRFRCPYDPIIMVMAFEVYGIGLAAAVGFVRRKMHKTADA